MTIHLIESMNNLFIIIYILYITFFIYFCNLEAGSQWCGIFFLMPAMLHENPDRINILGYV